MPTAGQDLENRLIAALNGELSRDAHDYVCRKLAIVGTAAAVPALAGLLGNKATSHMARFALERITAPEAGHALRDALRHGEREPEDRRDQLARRPPRCGGRRARWANCWGTEIRRSPVPRPSRWATIGTAESASVLQAALQSGNGDKQAVIDAPAVLRGIALGRDKHGRRPGDLQVAVRRGAATTRAFGRHTRPAGLCRSASLTTSLSSVFHHGFSWEMAACRCECCAVSCVLGSMLVLVNGDACRRPMRSPTNWCD